MWTLLITSIAIFKYYNIVTILQCCYNITIMLQYYNVVTILHYCTGQDDNCADHTSLWSLEETFNSNYHQVNSIFTLQYKSWLWDTLGKWPSPPLRKSGSFLPEAYKPIYIEERHWINQLPGHTGPSTMHIRYVCPYIWESCPPLIPFTREPLVLWNCSMA